ncbi:MAG: hypothetical protein CL943_01225 [Candidatus Diapherotrites archaeon]|uniref:Uncharacterized protein n=1 Tax=Candidatus Iainarchaeum sp. TaxID=3101447 RepID=A0A2D6M0F9_9ARCH|nr:hypothetical protein [Candidatus Diapherotrites archaeon]|tara:strand:+ start:1991 stop:2644 length:654 start_codon:yes stop_codon:yes gene_type:complete
MTRNIISNYALFSKKLPKSVDRAKYAERIEALKHYFSKGGIIRISDSSDDFPKLLYPGKVRIKSQVDELHKLRQLYHKRLVDWRKKLQQAQVYFTVNNVKKLKEPLYWKHMAKYLSNKDYRNDADKVKLPVNLVADRRWKPMVKMFVNDLDYRKQLTQTVDESIVYAKDKKVAKYAEELQSFRSEQSSRKIGELEKKLAEIDASINALQEINKWASL